MELQQNQAAGNPHGMVDKAKFEELVDLIEQKEREIQALQQDFKSRSSNQGSASQYEANLRAKDRELEELRQMINNREV
jgi:predicted RNase H-like nuclease (RuvC/YqgF family)